MIDIENLIKSDNNLDKKGLWSDGVLDGLMVEWRSKGMLYVKRREKSEKQGA